MVESYAGNSKNSLGMNVFSKTLFAGSNPSLVLSSISDILEDYFESRFSSLEKKINSQLQSFGED